MVNELLEGASGKFSKVGVVSAEIKVFRFVSLEKWLFQEINDRPAFDSAPENGFSGFPWGLQTTPGTLSSWFSLIRPCKQ